MGVGALILAMVVLAIPGGLRSAPWFLAGWFVAWGGLVLCFLGRSSLERIPREGAWFILGLAAVLRLVALCMPLELSDDVYRYIWDGRVVWAGADPYFTSPDDEQLTPLRDELWQKTAHREVESVYPPLAQGLFAIAAASPAPVATWRGLVFMFDMLSCWLLIRLLARAGRERSLALLYAWNPLIVLEGVGMGHVDIVGVLPLVLASTLLVVGLRSDGSSLHALAAGAALSAGVLIKVVPVVLLVPWAILLWRRRSWRSAVLFLGSAAATLGLGSWPMLRHGLPPGLRRYGTSWEFNGAIFEPLWRSLDALEAAPRVKTWIAAGIERGMALESWYPFIYPQFLAKVCLLGLLAVCSLALWWWIWREAERRVAWPEVSSASLGIAMVCAAVLYPWYSAWILPFAAALGHGPTLLLSFSLGFSYLPRLTGWESFPAIWALVWMPPLCLWLWHRLRSRREARLGVPVMRSTLSSDEDDL